MAPPIFAAAANHKIFPRTVDGPAMQALKLDGYHLMYPGDCGASGYWVYNCRCTTVVVVDGVGTGDTMCRVRDPETGQNALVEDMTYDEWVKVEDGQRCILWLVFAAETRYIGINKYDESISMRNIRCIGTDKTKKYAQAAAFGSKKVNIGYGSCSRF